MLRRKLHESLTVRIFLITLLILLGAGSITFALIAWATPITYTAAASDDLRAQTDLLVERLSVTALEDCGPILDEFIRASKSSVMLVDANGHIVQDTNSQLSIQSVYEDESTIVTVTSDSSSPHRRSSPCGTGTRPQPSSRRMAGNTPSP